MFLNEEYSFTIKNHGNAKSKDVPFKRTQTSTLNDLKAEVKLKPPRVAWDNVVESSGGIKAV